MKHYDLIIIGGGAGAFAAAIKANELGAKTAMINSGLPLGGTCVNVGCVPSKTLLHAAELLDSTKHHSVEGIELMVKKTDYTKVVSNELELVDKLRHEKYEQVLQSLVHLTFIAGKAVFIAKNAVAVGEQQIEADKLIIASGSKAIIPNIVGLAQAGYITHIEAMHLKTVPERLAVIGAGPIGLELGQLYARFGSQVTILQKSASIMPKAEPSLTNQLQKVLIDEGINIKTNIRLSKVLAKNGVKTVYYLSEAGEKTIEVDEILLAAGKTPNTRELNLMTANVEVDSKQAIVTQPNLQTSQTHIYAVGDVTNLPVRLETTAGREGTYAVGNALNGTNKSIDYHSVPWTVFTDPQLASVGYSEEEQMAELKVCACRSLSFDKLPKALITNRIEGLIKMAIHPESEVIMGVHILAPNAADLIAQAMTLIKNKNTVSDLAELLPVFPTLSEAIK